MGLFLANSKAIRLRCESHRFTFLCFIFVWLLQLATKPSPHFLFNNEMNFWCQLWNCIIVFSLYHAEELIDFEIPTVNLCLLKLFNFLKWPFFDASVQYISRYHFGDIAFEINEITSKQWTYLCRKHSLILH